MIASPTTEMFPPYPDDLFWQLIEKLENSLEFQGKSRLVFWNSVYAHESRIWCPRDLLTYFLEPPVPIDLLPSLIDDDNGLYAADDPRRFELLLDSVYDALRQYAEFIHVG